MGRNERSVWKFIRETAIVLVVALVLAVGVKTFFLQAFYIPSGSMEPGLVTNDRILVEKPSYWFSDPKRGDVIVFSDPGDWLGGIDEEPTGMVATGLSKIGLYPSGGHLVKRVIGVGGDTIVCCDEEGRLSVNGTALHEDAFIDPQPDCDGPMADCSTGWSAKVPAGKFFVMGDNRDESADSSFHLCADSEDDTCNSPTAFVDRDDVVGRVIARVWPLNRFKFETRPDIFDEIADPSAG